MTITYRKLIRHDIYQASKTNLEMFTANTEISYIFISENLQLDKPNSLCFVKISKFPVFSLTVNFGHFPCFPCPVGTLQLPASPPPPDWPSKCPTGRQEIFCTCQDGLYFGGLFNYLHSDGTLLKIYNTVTPKHLLFVID